MTSINSSLEPEIQRLREVRHGFLRLHKALLDAERETYEQHFGKIQTNGDFFQLVISHEWFDWLRPMSQFIVQVDELLDDKDAIAASQIDDLIQQAKKLLKASEEGAPAEQRYDQAIQRSPDIAFMHAALLNSLK
ncbi:hypothetical protein JOY44_10535 [Phormidium sp. CLA17]|uniref:hypothetical protein n=1 Tax=Leptolyngbya sp. Cla-17 TaxID=2803751 RepID=UPI001491F378|nr:hypothetical protein [Leptolyngbya sp. Cla-17]MBM0742051.1 hypothetical protein [Leptolyngbya sp. Cla-17]